VYEDIYQPLSTKEREEDICRSVREKQGTSAKLSVLKMKWEIS
jgi:hypothetical protein